MYSSRYMAQFVVAAKEEARLAPVVASVYPNDNLKVWTGIWLVSDEGVTAQDVCRKLGANEGQYGSVIVTLIGGYYGYAGKNIWEWLTVKGTPKQVM